MSKNSPEIYLNDILIHISSIHLPMEFLQQLSGIGEAGEALCDMIWKSLIFSPYLLGPIITK